MKIKTFQELIWGFYNNNKRNFAWRNNPTLYQVVVSEIMLQQTQTSRVEQKYAEFLKVFPSFEKLAQAPFEAVLKLWVGLGYNRRALALHKIAQRVVNEFNGKLPCCPKTLETFYGLGPATAASIVAFAFNIPTVFIETNIRAVYLHIFFKHQEDVHDKQLFPLIAQSVDIKNPREWYYALMDYGVHLKKAHKNPSRKSKHHSVQSQFEGSDRQIRGAIIKYYITASRNKRSLKMIQQNLLYDNARIAQQYKSLLKDGLIANL